MEAYLDNAATTRPFDEVTERMAKVMRTDFGNPSSLHKIGVQAERYVREAADAIAATLKGGRKNIIFTSGGTESNNMAIIGGCMARRRRGKHIITTKIEHHAVLHTCQYLEKKGYEVTYLDVDEDGMVRPEQLEQAVRPDTILISIMFANNEIGTIEPVREIGAIAKKHGVLFHTDAVQAFGHVPIQVDELNIDLLSASAHKFHGPKGIGFLYIRNSVKLGAYMHGGAQERSRRAGTSNVPGIVGMAKAAQLAAAHMEENAGKIGAVRDHLIERVLREIPYSRLNGHRQQRLPNNANFCFRFIEGESLLIMLDQKGICASSGSACTSGSLDPSHVLLAIGLPHEIAHGSLRLTLSEETTIEDADVAADSLKEIVERLRSMSPLYEDFVKENEKGGRA